MEMIPPLAWEGNCIASAIPTEYTIDIMNTAIFTLCLVLADVMLRICIECLAYLRYAGKPVTPWTMFTTLIWCGWGDVDGKRFLVSRGLRSALIAKITMQYPALFVFSALAFLLPDTNIAGWRFDHFISFTFLVIPVICEITSIIEKLNILDADIVRMGRGIVNFIKSVKEK